MKSPLGDNQRLLHVRDAINHILEFTEGINQEAYSSNIMIQSAVERQLEIIGEAVASMSEELKAKHSKIEWHKIKAFRNIIAHEYFGVSQKLVWNVIEKDIPMLKNSIEEILLSID
jgi:uncharacterized protein with HEPN domain